MHGGLCKHLGIDSSTDHPDLVLCCMYNIHILDERKFEDVKGEMTCVANTGRSIVASTSLFDSFTYFKLGCKDFLIIFH